MAPIAPYAGSHQDPKGPGDARPTALQIVEDEGLLGKLNDKVMLITGCTSGIGVETAKALKATGAKVYITARDVRKGEDVTKDINATNTGQPVEVIVMDLCSFDSIKAAASDLLAKTKKLNVLVNNAGVMGVPEGRTKDGYETTFATNHLGHFLLFQLLKPTLLASSTPQFASRVVSVSSGSHRMTRLHFDNYNLDKPDDNYNPWMAYGQSKIANIYFANEIERRYGPRGLHALSLHPGIIRTEISRHVRDELMFQQMRTNDTVIKTMKTHTQGAATSVWAAVGKEWEGKGGRYLEDVQEAELLKPGGDMFAPGYADHAYDEAAEVRLWKDSLRMVGMKDDAP